MSDLQQLIKAGALVVDVRSTEEYEDEHYPNALNIPVEMTQVRMSEYGDKNRPIIVYCASGARSAYAARFLKANGYTNVVNAGGLYDMPDPS
ncbi:MAG: rhodanese-like domain-containing protein [Bacteroidetes bacterium]|nr:MAG: rhodanese-like domain-containing protein [Bacteroidota bacterium]